jgi:hypothetical protein
MKKRQCRDGDANRTEQSVARQTAQTDPAEESDRRHTIGRADSGQRRADDDDDDGVKGSGGWCSFLSPEFVIGSVPDVAGFPQTVRNTNLSGMARKRKKSSLPQETLRLRLSKMATVVVIVMRGKVTVAVQDGGGGLESQSQRQK